MTVTPVARDELVYVSADHERLAKPVTASALSEASLVLAETSWREEDSSRRALRELLQHSGRTLRTRIEVEDVETAIELVGLGLADTVVPRGVATRLVDRLAPGAGWVSLRPKVYDTLAVVHRSSAALSPAARLLIELATKRIVSICEPVRTRRG
jgi:DNA-binding transcriptional LysR family regulator